MKRAKQRDYRAWHLLMSYDGGQWSGVWILGKAPREYCEPGASTVVRIARRPRDRRARVI